MKIYPRGTYSHNFCLYKYTPLIHTIHRKYIFLYTIKYIYITVLCHYNTKHSALTLLYISIHFVFIVACDAVACVLNKKSCVLHHTCTLYNDDYLQGNFLVWVLVFCVQPNKKRLHLVNIIQIFFSHKLT